MGYCGDRYEILGSIIIRNFFNSYMSIDCSGNTLYYELRWLVISVNLLPPLHICMEVYEIVHVVYLFSVISYRLPSASLTCFILNYCTFLHAISRPFPIKFWLQEYQQAIVMVCPTDIKISFTPTLWFSDFLKLQDFIYSMDSVSNILTFSNILVSPVSK